MAFDQPTRNRLARFVGEARALLTEEFTRQLQHEYGLDPARGEVTELAKLTQLDDARRETARILRETLAHYLAGQPAPTAKARQEALDRIVREQAFTVLNRLCALRMAEARGIVIESIAKGYQSRGFQLYARLAGTALGETGDGYRAYLFSLFDEFGVDLAVLFDRFSPQGRLFPRASTLLQLLAAINHPDLEPLWAEDETIGWIYQYFNSKEERKAMRDASQAPRNSRELAVRNQFFTPRYVVEFLTDNTLGRIWYEMTQGRTSLVDSCRYLVRRPHEVFLAEGQTSPEDNETNFNASDSNQGDKRIFEISDDSGQRKLLLQPIYIPYRRLKDPRTILILDPACGSMHFGLYSFDLYERIYEEAWELEGELGAQAFERPAAMTPLRERYRDKATFLRDMPRLIIEHNIHGIDIDPRAVQIAGLSLWLRAQKSWQAQGLKPHERPTIRKSNIVCAEPMPGNKALLEEFLQGLRDDRLEALIRLVLNIPENQRVRATPTMADALCELVRKVWEVMKLAGEAGSLLRIEEALTDAIAKGRAEWEEKMPLFRVETFRLTEETPKVNYMKVVPGEDVEFWARAEALSLAALGDYAGHADEKSYQRRLFAEDAVRGFAFIDLCRKRYEVVLMNPPFGRPSSSAEHLLPTAAAGNIYPSFVIRGTEMSKAFVGVISDRTFVVQQSFTEFRNQITNKSWGVFSLIELGWGVLDDADVQVAMYFLQNGGLPVYLFANLRRSDNIDKRFDDLMNGSGWTALSREIIAKLPSHIFAHTLPAIYLQFIENQIQLNQIAFLPRGLGSNNANRTYKTWYEVPAANIGSGKKYRDLCNGGNSSPFFRDNAGVAEWLRRDGRLLVEDGYSETERAYDQKNYNHYFIPGLSFPKQSSIFNVAALPKDMLPTREGKAVLPKQRSDFLPLLAYLNSAYIRYFVDATNIIDPRN